MLPFQQNIQNLRLRLYDQIYTQKYVYKLHNKQICLCIYKIGNRYIICMYIFWDSIHVYSDFFLMVCGSICTSAFPFCHWSSEAPHSLRHAAREPFLLWPGDCGHPCIPTQTKTITGFGKPGFWRFQRWHPPNPSAQAILAKPFVLTGLRPPLVEGVGAGAVGKHMSKMVEKIWGKMV